MTIDFYPWTLNFLYRTVGTNLTLLTYPIFIDRITVSLTDMIFIILYKHFFKLKIQKSYDFVVFIFLHSSAIYSITYGLHGHNVALALRLQSERFSHMQLEFANSQNSLRSNAHIKKKGFFKDLFIQDVTKVLILL